MQHVPASRAELVLSLAEQSDQTLTPRHRELATLLLHAQGYVLLRGAIPVPLVEGLAEAFGRVLRDCQASRRPDQWLQTSQGEGAVFWERGSRWRIFPKLRPPFDSPLLVANPFVLAFLAPVLGDDLYCKYVSSDTCVKGAALQSPHRDFYTPGQAWAPSGFIVNVPLVHCGLDNGPLEVWPGGSHFWMDDVLRRHAVEANVQDGRNAPIEELAGYLDSRRLVLRPGDVLVRDPAMWHRGTPNESDEPRVMLTLSYFRRGCDYDYGSAEYNLEGVPRERLDPAVQRLFPSPSQPAPRRAARMRSLLAAMVGWRASHAKDKAVGTAEAGRAA